MFLLHFLQAKALLSGQTCRFSWQVAFLKSRVRGKYRGRYIYTLNTLDCLLQCIQVKTMFYLSSELAARELIIPTARCCGWWAGGFGWNRVQDGNTIAVSLVQSFCTRDRLFRNKPGLKAPALYATSFNPFKLDSIQFTLKAGSRQLYLSFKSLQIQRF